MTLEGTLRGEGVTLEEVLNKHYYSGMWVRYNTPDAACLCSCKEEYSPNDLNSHIAAVVRTWLVAELERDDVREAVRSAEHRAFHDEWGGPGEELDLYALSAIWRRTTTAALDTVARMVGGAE